MTTSLTPAQLDELEEFLTAYRHLRATLPNPQLPYLVYGYGEMHAMLHIKILDELLALGRAQEAGLNRLAEAAEVTADPDTAHSIADEALLAAVSPDVREAYRAVQEACSWWATA